MVVVLVDQHDVRVGVLQLRDGADAGEAASEDDDAGSHDAEPPVSEIVVSLGALSLRSAEARAEDVVRPALVQEDERDEDHRHDGHHLERVVRRRGVVDGEAVLEGGARHHHARVERDEQRRHERDRPERRHRECPPVAPRYREDDRERERHDPERRGERRREEILVVAVHRDRDGPDEVRRGQHGRRDREPSGDRLGAVAQLACRAKREEGRAVEREERHDRDSGEHAVRAEEIQEVAGEVAVRVDRGAVQEPRQPDPPEKRRAEAADRVRPRPRRPPPGSLALRAPLERDDADDEEDEDEQEREVEAGEHRRVPGRERRERGASGHDEPDLVPVPDRSDRPQSRAPLLVRARDERKQHPDPEVEPLEQEVHRPDDDDDAEPEGLEIHQYVTAGSANSSPSPPTSGGSMRAYLRMRTTSTTRSAA